MTRKAEESLDPFQVALDKVCRAHKLTLGQFIQKGGSGSLVIARREALLDLLQDKWLEKTIQTVVNIGETDMKRLRKDMTSQGCSSRSRRDAQQPASWPPHFREDLALG